MIRYFRILVACTLMTVSSLARADPTDTNQPLNVTLELSDGSRIVGVPGFGSVPVQTAYAMMDIPLAQILSIKMGDDHERAAFEMANGDRLTGVITLGPLKLATVFGDVSVGKENKGVAHGPRFTAEGRSGGALAFDGVDDYMEAGTPPSLQLTANFTLSAWIWPERTKDSFGIITKSQGSPEQDRRGIEFMLGHDDTLSAYFWDESTRFFSGVVKNRTIARQEWTHVVLQHDSSLPQHQMRFYINGVACEAGFGYESISSIPVVRNVAEPVRVGCMRPGVHHFKGRMDDVMIFNRALSSDEIQALCGTRK